jgi:hypothetical protein
MTPIYALLIAFVSWLLGLLTPGIVDLIRRTKERRELAAGIRVELGELRARLALNAWSIWNRNGLLTIENIRWVIDAIESAPDRGRISKESLDAMHQMIANGPENLAKLNRHNQEKRAGFSATTRRIDAPFLILNLGRLPYFTDATQRQILFIKAQIDLFNDQVEETAGFFQMTFSSNLAPENWNRVNGNLTAGEQRLATRSRVLADAIADLEIS